MPKISGIFENFENLEKIPYEDIARWLKRAPEKHVLENYLANRIIYSHNIPVSEEEQNIDLAILREALRRNTVFYKLQQKKIYIPEIFLQVSQDIKKLVQVFIDAYEPKGLVAFILNTRAKDEVLGSLITVSCGSANDTLYFDLEGRNFKVQTGSLTILPCLKEHCHINFKASSSTIFGKNNLLFEVSGGRLGLIIDGRRR